VRGRIGVGIQRFMASVLRESKAAPSTFAVLLRTSKFASYDPQISQIYTSYDGHAHRGNWGLKRPVSQKRKSGDFIVVKSIDSKEQQTEWYRAEQEARWLKVVSELGKSIDVRTETSSWYNYLGESLRMTYDSDYNLNPNIHSRYGPNVDKNDCESHNWNSTDKNRFRSSHIPNATAMNKKEFRHFLAELHRSRPRLKSLVDKKIEDQTQNSMRNSLRRFPYPPLNQVNSSAHRFHMMHRFFKKEVSRPFLNDGPKKLLPSPHHNAALTYLHASDLTSKILHTPVPGRVFSGIALRDSQKDSKHNPGYVVGVAGLLGRLQTGDALKRQPTKLSDEVGNEIAVPLQAKHMVLMHAPHVVNAPGGSSGFETTQLRLEFVEYAKIRSEMTNPYLPGSQAYVAHHDPSTDSPKGVSQSMSSQSQQARMVQRKKSNRGSQQPRNQDLQQSHQQYQKQKQIDKVNLMLTNTNATAKSNLGLDEDSS
jgi:hypothetical protein